MGFIGTAELLDFVSSLAVLGILVIGFSALGHRLKRGPIAPLIQGGVFGLVVVLQMSMPLSPTEGVLVDMRNIPIVLAGAFLGLRGLCVCLVIAVATRVGLGGVGTASGVLGMLIAGSVGHIWARAVIHMNTPDWAKLLRLGLVMNLHMLSAFIAPADIMRWYFLEAAPTVLLLNLICVPLIGALLMREQHVASTQARLAAAAQVDPVTRLLFVDAFAREITHFNASHPGDAIGGVVAVTVKDAGWLRDTWGAAALDQTLGALRVRVSAACSDGRPFGLDAKRRVLIPVTDREMRDLRPFRKAIRRLATEAPFLLDGNVELPLSVVVENFSLRQPDRADTTVQDIRRSATARRVPSKPKAPIAHLNHVSSDAPLPDGLSSATLGRLFDQADAGLRRAA